MSASPQSNHNPNSLANLRPFKSGDEWRGHKGGKKGGNRVDVEYQRLLDMSADEAATFQPANGAQIIAYKQFLEACSNKKNSLDYAKEITDRTSGKVADRLEVTNGHSPETRQAIAVEAYLRVFSTKSLDESLNQIRAIYDAPDEQSRRLAIAAAIESDAEAIGQVWADAEKAVTGESK